MAAIWVCACAISCCFSNWACKEVLRLACCNSILVDFSLTIASSAWVICCLFKSICFLRSSIFWDFSFVRLPGCPSVKDFNSDDNFAKLTSEALWITIYSSLLASGVFLTMAGLV